MEELLVEKKASIGLKEISPWLKTNQIGDYRIYETDEAITQIGLENSSAKIVPKNALTIAMYGDGITRGKISIVGCELTTNQACCNIVLNDKCSDYRYVYYFLKSKYIELRHLSNGGAQQNLSVNLIKRYDISLPPLPTQRRIAAILASLDDKIENNRRICEKLEEMAQAIFKQWFVDFNFPDENGEPYKDNGGEMVESELGLIPKGWEVGHLKDIVNNVKDSCKQKDIIGLPYLPIDIIPKKMLGIDSYDSWENAKSSLVKFRRDDILLGAMRVYFYRVILSPFDGVTRTTCMVLRPKKTFYKVYSLLSINQDSLIDWASNNSKGSTMPYAFWNNGLENYKIVIPPDKILHEFEKLLTPLLKIIQGNFQKSKALQQTRDTLLPKLMSGEIDVEEK